MKPLRPSAIVTLASRTLNAAEAGLVALRVTLARGRHDAAEMRFWPRSKFSSAQAGDTVSVQLGFKDETDLALLHACIAPSMASDEFFLRKAIGWALRDLAWSDPVTAVRYVKRWEHALSPLTRREALRNVATRHVSRRRGRLTARPG